MSETRLTGGFFISAGWISDFFLFTSGMKTTLAFLILLSGLMTACREEAASQSETDPPETPPEETAYPGKLTITVGETRTLETITGVYVHAFTRKTIISYSDGRHGAGGTLGYFVLNTVETGIQNWKDIDSARSVVYSVLTGFDPDFENRYYCLPATGKTEITGQSDSVRGNFAGSLNINQKEVPVTGTFSFRNKADTLSLIFGYY